MNDPRALVLFSGGLDSTTVLHLARAEGFEPFALIFDYGQRHRIELDRAKALADELDVPWRLQPIDLRCVGGSALTADDIDVPKGRESEVISDSGVPVTYVPARNTVFLSHALAWAEVETIDHIFLGINALDYSGYPDCRPEYLSAFETLANLACRRTTEEGARLQFHAPLVDKTKAEIIEAGLSLGIDYSKTWSCYDPITENEAVLACGRCDSCCLRRKGFEEAGVDDPTPYAG